MSVADAVVPAEPLFYASLGWRVLPVAAGTKRPVIGRNWQKRATRDTDVLRRWWQRWPDAGVGVATGHGVVVLDVDNRQDATGDRSLEELIEQYGPLPVTPFVATGGGGWHFYFAGDCRGRAGFMAGLDLKGRGGFVVAPPTSHPNGSRYVWKIDPANVPLAPLPTWLLPSPGKPPRTSAPAVPPPAAAGGSGIPEGFRHNHLIHRAGVLRHEGVGVEAILADLLAYNHRRCTPPLPQQEVEEIASWVSEQPSFGEQFDTLARAWEEPTPGRIGQRDWKVKQALLRIAFSAQSTIIGPGVRRLALEAQVSTQTAQNAVRSLVREGSLSTAGRPLRGRPQQYRLRLATRAAPEPPQGSRGGSPSAPEVHPPAGGAREIAHLHGFVGSRWREERAEPFSSDELLAFRGRENALRLYRLLDEEQPRTPAELRDYTGMPRSTVTDNLRWLRGNGLARRARLLGPGKWLRRTYPYDTEALMDVLAFRRGKHLARHKASLRYKLEQEGYDRYFRARYGFDRKTGEVLDER